MLLTTSAEQSGFTSKKSERDRILALRDLTERLREFRTGVPHWAVGSLYKSPQGLRLGEPRCTLGNLGPTRKTPKSCPADIRPVFEYECCEM